MAWSCPPVGEIRALHVLHEAGRREIRRVDEGHAGVDHFAQVVRGDVRRHPDGDPLRAVDEEVREPRREDDRLLRRAVVVRSPIDGALAELAEELARERPEPALGVTHGGGAVAVDGAEVAVPVDERRAHHEVLREADHRVVDRDVAVRVVFTHHVADHAGALLRLGVGVEVQIALHRVEDAALHRLQAVAHVGERTRRDDAERVVEVATLRLFGERGVGDGRRRRRVTGRRATTTAPAASCILGGRPVDGVEGELRRTGQADLRNRLRGVYRRSVKAGHLALPRSSRSVKARSTRSRQLGALRE